MLGDLGVFQMREAMKNFPSRVINFGIMEQTMIGFCGGLSRGGFYPIMYSITPFLVDRGYEQIKIDLIYNNNPCLVLYRLLLYPCERWRPQLLLCQMKSRYT